MSLTLFPITALLLLLSGVGTPVHATGYKETIAALRKQFLGAPATGSRAAVSHRHDRASLAAWHAAWDPVSAFAVDRRFPLAAAVGVQNGPVRAWERKQYCTRFGSPEGAYLALGPPADAPFAIFG